MNIHQKSNIFIGETPFSQKPEIPGLLNYLKREYYDRAQALYSVYDTTIEHHMNSQNVDRDDRSEDDNFKRCGCGSHRLDKGEFCRLCHLEGTEDRDKCNSIVIGSIIRGYHRQKSVLAQCDPAEKTLEQIYRHLQDIKIYSFPSLTHNDESTNFSKDHYICSPVKPIRYKLRRTMENIAKVLDPDMGIHLDHQANLTGLDEQSMKAREKAPMTNKKN
ncbi:hypothetical protein PG996_004427 [Apiospora saccharicola]|uniref:Uncharacterized protein n=1 Tax=Apiospora saccharicola TaxID=335842 RepID=A0ABR1W455_9PEZI